jgi:hypothetical protein
MPAGIAKVAYSPKNPRALREQGSGDDLLVQLPGRWVWAMGYYQLAKYPILMRDEISQRILPFLDALQTDARQTDVIGIHVRLGDYVTSQTTQAHHGVTNAAYFAEAVAKLRERVGDLPIRVFTDSPEAFKSAYLEALAGDVEISEAAGSWDALNQISSCSAIVMSNSSFSWWAAFIATVLRGAPIPVVMPTPWYAADSAADKHLSVDGWQQMRRLITTP